MPYHRSLYGLTPVGPTVNYYDFLVGRPDLQSWPDYTLFVDAMTGKRRRFRETLARIEECASALSSEGRDGGLEIEPGSKEVVGILSENCMVGGLFSIPLFYMGSDFLSYQGIPRSGSGFAQDLRTCRLDPRAPACR